MGEGKGDSSPGACAEGRTENMTSRQLRSNVIEQVVARGLCCGCGVCAGLSRCRQLEIVQNADGEYVPVSRECTDCGLCLEVCPFARTPTAIAIDAPLGETVAVYVGYSTMPGERERGSSGGLATRLLKALLETGLVDGAIAPVPTGQPDRVFEAAVLRTTEEIDRAAGSKYYPIEFSQVLDELKTAEGRYALIGLPCAITALTRARSHDQWVAQRVPYLFGLTCGRGVSTQYTSLLAHISGLRGAPLADVNYRSKEGTVVANDFAFIAQAQDGATGRPLHFTDGWVNQVWGHGLLTPEACYSCTDLFAVHADVSFMDAWLPECFSDPKGTSIIVVRSAEMASLVEDELTEGRLAISPISEAKVLSSQAGALRRRRQISQLIGQAPFKLCILSAPRLLWHRLSLWHQRRRARLCKWLLRGDGLRRAIGLRVLTGYIPLLRALGSVRALGSRVKKALRAIPLRKGAV